MKHSKETKRLNVILLCTSNHLGSTIIANKLFTCNEVNIKSILCAPPISFTRSGLSRLKKKMKKLGWHFSFLLVWIQLWNKIGQSISYLLPTKRNVLSLRILSKKFNIPLINIDDINSAKTKKLVEYHKPDIIISAFFCQILKPNIFNIPRKGTLNIHPGWLPAYRGAMSYFWVLKNNEDSAGASIHYIDETIDTGKLVARKQFKITPGMTQHTVLIQTATIGAKLLENILKNISSNVDIPTIKTENEAPGYYAFPGNKEFDSYFKRNRFFRIRDIFGYFLK